MIGSVTGKKKKNGKKQKHLAKKVARRCCENSANTIGACGEVARLVTARPGLGFTLPICIFTLWIKIKTVGARRCSMGRHRTRCNDDDKAIDECWRQMQNVPAGGSHETSRSASPPLYLSPPPPLTESADKV